MINFKKTILNKKFVISFGLAFSLLVIASLGYKIIAYKAYIWLPYYFQNDSANNFSRIKDGHVMFLFVDHHCFASVEMRLSLC